MSVKDRLQEGIVVVSSICYEIMDVIKRSAHLDTRSEQPNNAQGAERPEPLTSLSFTNVDATYLEFHSEEVMTVQHKSVVVWRWDRFEVILHFGGRPLGFLHVKDVQTSFEKLDERRYFRF